MSTGTGRSTGTGGSKDTNVSTGIGGSTDTCMWVHMHRCVHKTYTGGFTCRRVQMAQLGSQVQAGPHSTGTGGSQAQMGSQAQVGPQARTCGSTFTGGNNVDNIIMYNKELNFIALCSTP